jgi:SAM-dependent methyltransferase
MLFQGRSLRILRATANKKVLKDLMFSAPFRIERFDYDGRRMNIFGAYYPLEPSLAGVSILLNGLAPTYLEFVRFDGRGKHDFWFLNPESTSFHARFNLGEVRTEENDAFAVSALNIREPLDPLRIVYIPTAKSDYNDIPEASRIRRVSGHTDGTKFVFRGRSHFQSLKSLAERHGRKMSRVTRVLDWGVGCGRIARHFLRLHPHIEFHGIDIDTDNIKWCASHLPGGHFAVGPLFPPLPFPDDYFDLIIANSVFTHLTEQAQNRWLPELARILRPGGVGLATIHGESSVAQRQFPINSIARWKGPLDWIVRWKERGIDDASIDTSLSGLIADDHYYRGTFHTKDYVESHWRTWVDIRTIERNIIASQDVVVFEKKKNSVT